MINAPLMKDFKNRGNAEVEVGVLFGDCNDWRMPKEW